MFNKFKNGFYFEKYKTAEEAKAVLLELHPIGSDVGELVRTLEKAGGKCAIREDKVNKSSNENGLKYMLCTYNSKKIGYISLWIWNDESGYWNNSNNSLVNLVIHYRSSMNQHMSKNMIGSVGIIHPIFSTISAINRLKIGFRFEKYKTAEAAEEVLLRIYPVGSKVGELIKSLEKAGAECSITDWKVNKEHIDPLSSVGSLNIKEKIFGSEDGYLCSYEEPELVFSTSWQVDVHVDPEDFSKIKKIKVNSQYNYL